MYFSEGVMAGKYITGLEHTLQIRLRRGIDPTGAKPGNLIGRKS